MSDPVHLNAPSYSPTLFGSKSSGGSLLASLHRYATPSPASSSAASPSSPDPAPPQDAEVLWRDNLDKTTPGLTNAIDFQARASTISSVSQVLGDPIFRTVVTTALGIPGISASQPEAAQERAISSRIDLTRFKSPGFVAQFTQRYLEAARQEAGQIEAAPAAGTQSPDLII